MDWPKEGGETVAQFRKLNFITERFHDLIYWLLGQF